MKRYRLRAITSHDNDLDFSWNPETGEVTGKSADIVKHIADWGGVPMHPYPATWDFSDSPLKSKTDMAAIIGFQWRLPEDLQSYYPKLENDDSEEFDRRITVVY